MSKKNKRNKSTSTCAVDRLIKEIEEIKKDNAKQSENLEKLLKDLYEKNEKSNEIKKGFDAFIQGLMVTLFIVFGIACIGSIFLIINDPGLTCFSKIEFGLIEILLGVLLLILARETAKEKNRNYLVSCFSAIVAAVALLIALFK